MNESYCCYTFPPAFDVFNVLDISQSNRCVVVSHCFNLYFPDDIEWGVYFHIHLYYLNIFFSEVSVKVFGPFLNWVVFFLIVEF